MSGNGFELEHGKGMGVVRAVASGNWEHVVFGLAFGPCTTWVLCSRWRDAVVFCREHGLRCRVERWEEQHHGEEDEMCRMRAC